MDDRFTVALTGVICITLIAVACIAKGLDGVIVGSSVGVIGTIIGGIFGYLQGKNTKN